MKMSCVVVVYLLALVSLSAAEPHVRRLDGLSAVAYDYGYERSETFRGLVAALEHSDVIVHVVSTRDLPLQVAGTTRFVGRQGGWRYVRVSIASTLMPKYRVTVLAHELQHALEIAESGAGTRDAVLAFYQAKGLRAPTLADGWETLAAAEVERRVWSELGRLSSRAARTTEQ